MHKYILIATECHIDEILSHRVVNVNSLLQHITSASSLPVLWRLASSHSSSRDVGLPTRAVTYVAFRNLIVHSLHCVVFNMSLSESE